MLQREKTHLMILLCLNQLMYHTAQGNTFLKYLSNHTLRQHLFNLINLIALLILLINSELKQQPAFLYQIAFSFISQERRKSDFNLPLYIQRSLWNLYCPHLSS